MKAQYDNKITSSFLLWLDNKILDKGEAYTTVSTQFYPNNAVFNGYYTYSSPYKQIVADRSITGATVFTGVYINNTIVGTGTSGLRSIDYNNGNLYFSGALPASTIVSGTYTIKDFNVVLTDIPEERLLFETKFSPKPRTAQTATGLPPDGLPFPIIFIRTISSENEPFEFGGTDLTRNMYRILVLADSQFAQDGVNSILRDQKRAYVPILEPGEFPFNALGYATGYNYTGLTDGKITSNNAAYIDGVYVARFNQNQFSQQIREVNPIAFQSIIDIELTKDRQPNSA